MEVHDLRGPVSKCADIFPDATTWGCGKEFTNPEALTRHFDSHTVFFPRDLMLTLGEPYGVCCCDSKMIRMWASWKENRLVIHFIFSCPSSEVIFFV